VLLALMTTSPAIHACQAVWGCLFGLISSLVHAFCLCEFCLVMCFVWFGFVPPSPVPTCSLPPPSLPFPFLFRPPLALRLSLRLYCTSVLR
jgi:hypothetical protein